MLVYAGELTVSEEVQLEFSPRDDLDDYQWISGLGQVWHPAVVASASMGSGKAAGSIRILTLGPEASIVEKLVSMTMRQ